MHGRWFIFWDDLTGRAAIRCECGQQFRTLPAWARHSEQAVVQ
jgi:hypothetical protein